MAVNYASGLSDYPHKGKCGAPEVSSASSEAIKSNLNVIFYE